MSSGQYINRIIKEYKQLQKKQVPNILALPHPKNVFDCHFMIYDLEDAQYSQGFYYGVLSLPPEYPMKPPKLKFITPNGRFKTNEQICLSYTNFHNESWSAAWDIEKMLLALVSFMHDNEATTGGLNTSKYEKQYYAKKSIENNLKIDDFNLIFKPYFKQLGIEQILNNENYRKEQMLLDKSFQQKQMEKKKQSFIILSILIILIAYVIFKSLM